MRNIKLTLEYDGTRFFGSQIQKRYRTIQGELEAALQKLFHQKIKIIAAGRTDSGVHAEGQVVNFQIRSKLALPKIHLGLNHYLPEDLVVTEIKQVPASFHAQYSAKRKVYEYRVFNSRHRSALERFRSFYFPFPVELNQMKQAARLLCGKHNFRAFESSGSRRRSAIRTIRKFEVKKEGKIIYFTVEADGFLYKMVRSMVGTLLEVGSGKLKLAIFKEILAQENRRLVGFTAPPQGLTLKQVIY
ncbi:MAG: tRNA pseudouridine(38-40) synthase TruA [Candidatus Omnitrophica bacterium]|nr:tRNA pseudouridine(38-40) synthase TruA [Candidatus Omnitrophota bacterium]